MKQTTIYLTIEENIDAFVVFAKAPGDKWNDDRRALAAELGIKDVSLGIDTHTLDLDDVVDRIKHVAEKRGAIAVEKSKTFFRVTRKVEPVVAPYEFPEGSFGYDSTKWGPTDFYDNTREALAAAFKSGLDFETPWMSCKKEILSSQITRTGNVVSIEVSVSDDFDTNGTGESSFKVNRATTVDRFFEKLETAGGEAHGAADDNRKDNQVYCGYSVGKVRPDGKNDWKFTYLVSTGGFDVPPGDNYFRWGWQEVDDKVEDFDIDAHPEEIPPGIAKLLAEGMQNFETTVRAGDWQATVWND